MSARLTIGELAALGEVRGVVPRHVVGDVAEDEFRCLVAEGMRSLIARSLVSDDNGAVVPHREIAPWLDVVLDPTGLLTLVTISANGSSLVTLMTAGEAFVVARHLAIGVFDLWPDSAEGVGSALADGMRQSDPVILVLTASAESGPRRLLISKDLHGAYAQAVDAGDAIAISEMDVAALVSAFVGVAALTA